MLVNNSSHFTENVLPEIDAGSHILYIFNELDKYIENSSNFIHYGLLKNEVILFVDTKGTFDKVINRLKGMGYHSTDLHNIIFADSTETYIVGDEFSLDKTGNLINVLNPYFDEGYRIRTWGNVILPDHECTLERLRIFEHNSDHFISKSKLISVCAYNGLTLPAYLQNELMRTHTHFMTDSEYTISPLYDRKFLQIPTNEEKEQLQKLTKKNKELTNKNNRLANEKEISKVIIENQQKFRAIIEQLPFPIVIRRDTKVLFINNSAKEQFMMNGQKDITNEYHFLQFIKEYDKGTTLENKKFHKHEFILNNRKKKYYIVKSIELLFEGESSILHSFIDISQEKENESLIVRTEKMNIAGELAAGIAHEIRNPLTAVKGFFQMLKRGGNKIDLYYSVIDDELSRIEQITSELLTLAKPHSENRKNHNIVKLIEEVKFLLTSQANDKSIEIIVEAAKSEVLLSCEETKIKQVFINLVKNSIDAMDRGGKVVIEINEVNENIEVLVLDQGDGIPEEVMKKIGEPFYTTKEKGKGIGLMVCYKIIENHKGKISVESENGVGTTFTITLPVLIEE